MLGERTRPDAKVDIVAEVGLIDRWAAELTAIAYGSVPTAHVAVPDAVRAPRLTLISSIDEPVPISPNLPNEVPTRVIEVVGHSPLKRAEADPAIEQLARDIVAITHARDALFATDGVRRPAAPSIARRPPLRAPRPPKPKSAPSPERASVVVAFVPVGMGRTADSVPIILGSVLGFLMITIFSVAAVFIKFAR